MEASMAQTVDTAFSHHDPLLRDVEACKILGISKPTFWRWVRVGILPKPVKLGSKSRWPRSDMSKFIERAFLERETAA